ncbi:MAG: preprotein translocase subunit SecG [Candidatus Saccharimonadales bacterium]
MQTILQITSIISALMMIVLILAQSRGTGLGQAFGGDSSFYFSRRGVELVMYQLTIIFAVVFVLSIILGLVVN